MISHGLISAALFLCVGVLYDRMKTRLISNYGGVVDYLPKFSFIFMIFVLGSLGLPGTTGFIGELLVLVGIFKKNYLVAILAAIGVILAAAYMLWLTKRVIFGEVLNSEVKNLKDVNASEFSILIILALTTLIFGFYPEPLLDTISVSTNNLLDNYYMQIDNNIMSENKWVT